MTQTLGPVMLDLEGTELRSEERELLMRQEVGGVILFARNVEHARQVRELCNAIRSVRPGLLLAIDQEGGRVQRLRDGVTRLPAMGKIGRDYAANPEVTLRLCLDAGWLLGMEMAACGLDLSFAPVLDVDSGISTVIGDRSFSSDPHAVAAMAGPSSAACTKPAWQRWASIFPATAACRPIPTWSCPSTTVRWNSCVNTI